MCFINTTRIPEMNVGRYLNLNKMKTKNIKSHEPIFYSQYNRKQMFKLRNLKSRRL